MNAFEKNLEEIKKYNPVLAHKLKNYVLDKNIKLEFIQSESGDLNLSYNGILYHDNKDPNKEARIICENLKNNSGSSINIVFGIGLGYLFKKLYLNSKGKIIIYEPDINVLLVSLKKNDFSFEFGNDRVYVASNQSELIKFLEEIYPHKANINICALNSGNAIYAKELGYLKNNLAQISFHLEANYNTLFSKSFFWATAGIANIPLLAESYNIDALKDKFKSKPAVIVSSGPSLDKAAEYLAKYRNKIVIFCTSNACRTLANYNIKPDFITFIEVFDNTAQVIDIDISESNIIVQSVACNNAFRLPAKRKFAFYSNNDLFSRWISKIADFSIENYETKGTVSYCALNSAFMAGCNPIILVGQDLAYTDGKCYSEKSSYGALKYFKDETSDQYKFEINNPAEFKKYFLNEKYSVTGSELLSMKDEAFVTWNQESIKPELTYYKDNNKILWTQDSFIKLKLDEVNSNLTIVLGQNGEMLPTDSNYAGFIKYFEQFAYNYSNLAPDLELINSSTGGAQINGFKNIELEKVFKSLDSSEIDTELIVKNALSSYNEPVKAYIDDISYYIKSMIEDIDEFTPLAKEGFTKAEQLLLALDKTELDLKLIRTLTANLMENYIKFQEDLFDNHQILIGCVFKDLLELSNIFEDDNVKVNGIDDLKNIAKTSLSFYEAYLYYIIVFRDIAERVLLEIN